MSYENDFAKHAEPTDVPKIQLIWDSLPSQLARENKKFLYSAVKDGARAREYENALNWLYNADLVRKTFRISKPGLPLSAYDDLTAFKIYLSFDGKVLNIPLFLVDRTVDLVRLALDRNA